MRVEDINQHEDVVGDAYFGGKVDFILSRARTKRSRPVGDGEGKLLQRGAYGAIEEIGIGLGFYRFASPDEKGRDFIP